MRGAVTYESEGLAFRADLQNSDTHCYVPRYYGRLQTAAEVHSLLDVHKF